MKEEKNETPKKKENSINKLITFTNYKTKPQIYTRLIFEPLDLEKNYKKVKIVSKSASHNIKNIKLKEKYFSSHKQLLIDLNIINLFNYKNISSKNSSKNIKENDESNNSNDLETLKEKLQYKNNEMKLLYDKQKKGFKNEEEKITKYYTPKKERKTDYINKILEKGKKIVKKVRKEKNIKDNIPKHHHQEKKDREEEIHMSDFKPQNKKAKEKIEIIGEEEEEINHISKNEEKNDLKENENNIYEKNEVIDEFLKDLEKGGENKNNEKQKKEDESEDPFEKAENEYRLKHNESIEDEDDIIKNIDLDMNEISDKEKDNKNEIIENNINEKEEKEKEINKTNENEEKPKNEVNIIEKLENNKRKNKFNYFKSYISSLNKKCKNFNPLISERPGNIYLKEVYQNKNYKDKMKKYNKKTGKFDLFINKQNINRILSLEGIRYHEYHDSSKENITNNTLEIFKKYPKKINGKLVKKIKEQKFYIKSFSNKYLINTIHTSRTKQKHNFVKKFLSKDNKQRRIKTDTNIKIRKGNNIQNMMQLLLEKENEKINKKLNPINNKRRNSDQKEKIINILNDPYNPYSTIWPNKFLNVNYNSEIKYREIEQGVPQLKVKQFKKKNLPPIYYRNIPNKGDKIFFSTFSSGFNINLNARSNKNIFKMKNIKNKTIEDNKDTNNNESQKDNIEDINNILTNKTENKNFNNKNESEIIEEDF